MHGCMQVVWGLQSVHQWLRALCCGCSAAFVRRVDTPALQRWGPQEAALPPGTGSELTYTRAALRSEQHVLPCDRMIMSQLIHT